VFIKVSVIFIPSIDDKSNEYVNNMVITICLLKLKPIIYIKNVLLCVLYQHIIFEIFIVLNLKLLKTAGIYTTWKQYFVINMWYSS